MRLLHRAACTPGTRVDILDSIVTWANDTSPDSPSVYWLFGPAGSGKSTIAYSIARYFEHDTAHNTITLGGNFFCSRQFEETREPKWIIRTIAHHLSRICTPFAIALSHSNKLDAVDHDLESQLQSLLVEPWDASDATRAANQREYLVVVDALDEIERGGGSDVLRVLFSALGRGRLRGLKFFATSRPDPSLVGWVNSFERKNLYRLQDVEKVQVSQDIEAYLTAQLPHFARRDEMKELVRHSDGLFIYAATVVRYLARYGPMKQADLLKQLLSIPESAMPDDTDPFSLDRLYRQILVEALPELGDDTCQEQLDILHALLCVVEPTPGVVTGLLSLPGKRAVYTENAANVINKLHAVLYDESGRVLFYHKSFSYFIFDSHRSQEFWCDQAARHRLLTESSFDVMKAGLKFNIANIPTSLILDCDNSALTAEIKRNIPAILQYSCRHWSYHLYSSVLRSPDLICHILAEFLRLHAIFWIEAMNLLNLASLCDRMLRNAGSWVRKVRHVVII